MRRIVLYAAGATAATGLAFASLLSRPPPPAPPPPAVAPPSDAEEAAALAGSRGLAWRDGPALSLRLKNGEVLTLTDRRRCGDLPCPSGLSVQYRYLGWDPSGGGYRLAVTPSFAEPMLLPWTEDPALVDSRAGDAPDGRGAHPRPQPAPPPPAPAQTQAGTNDGLNEWLADIAETRSRQEGPHLRQSGGRVEREGGRLSILLADRRRLILTDDLSCGQTTCPPQLFRSFSYDGDSPDGRYHVIMEQWDEAAAALLVDAASGDVTELVGPPSFSPDGKRAVATVGDLETPPPRRLEVWNLSGPAPGREYELPAVEGDDTLYQVLGWADPDHVRLKRGNWSGEGESSRPAEAMLARNGAGWHIETAEAGN